MNVTEEVTIHRPNEWVGDAYLHLVRKKVSDVWLSTWLPCEL